MRSFENSKSLIYASHIASQSKATSGGYETGDIVTTYATPVPIRLTVQPITNALTRLEYGVNANRVSRLVYSKGDVVGFVFALTDILWIGAIPAAGRNLVDSSAILYTHTVDQILDTGEQIVVIVKKRS